MLECPNCESVSLSQTLTRQGVEIDVCDECQGIWLDKGELFYFTSRPKDVSAKLDEALKNKQSGTKLSPRSGKPMSSISYGGKVTIDYCAETGGLWFDKDAVNDVLAEDSTLKMEVDAKGSDKKLFGEEKAAALKPRLASLPNLFLRSTVTLTGLYTMMTLALIFVVEFAGAKIEWAVFSGLAIIAFQFLIGPLIMDFMVGVLMSGEQIEPDQLPDHLRRFTERICEENYYTRFAR